MLVVCRTMCPTFREPSICFLLLSIAKSNNTKYNGISIQKQNTTIQPRRGRKSMHIGVDLVPKYNFRYTTSHSSGKIISLMNYSRKESQNAFYHTSEIRLF